MSLEIINSEITGKIDNLEDKLSGKLPVNRLELFELINSWGRGSLFSIENNINISDSKPKECYDLSKLDTSEITNMSSLFTHSLFDGDISNWNVSNVTNMNYMVFNATKFNSQLNNWDVSNVTDMSNIFINAIEFNQPLDNWNTSNVKNMVGMFFEAKSFNQPLLWDLSNVEHCYSMFYEAKAFENRFNNGNPLPQMTNEIKEWFKENMEKMIALEIKNNKKKDLDNYFENIKSTNLNLNLN